MSDQLMEHQAPQSSSTGEVRSPSRKEQDAIKLVNKLFDRAKKHRSRYDNKWLDYYKFFRGIQWEVQRPSYRHSEVINFIFQQIQSSVPILTDRQPKVEFLPMEPQDRAIAKILNRVMDYDWKRNNWSMSVIESLYDAHIYGVAYGTVSGKVKDGKGVIEYESADPFYAFPDPESWDVNKRGRYFIYAQPMDVEVARAKYPKQAKFIKPDLIDLVGGDKAELGKARFQSPTDKYSSQQESREVPDNYGEDTALHIECYLRSEETKQEKDGDQVLIKKRWPRGRKITIVGGVLVEDGDYPYEDFEDRFAPFAKMQNYVLPREFYGISEVEQLQSPQKIFNKMVSFTLDVLTLMGNPVWIIDTTSGIDPENLINRPGLVLEKEKGSEVRRTEGTQLQPYVINMIDRMQSWFNDLAGQTDVTAGAVPTGVTSGRAISAVQEAARTRLRLKSRLLDMFIQDIGQMYLSRVFQFYSAPQVFRITNDQEAQAFFKFSVEEDEVGEKVVRVRELEETEDGQVVDGPEAIMETGGKFDVVSNSGSGLPFAKTERMEKAFQLYDRQVIDAEALLTDIEYPNKEAVLERLKDQQAAAAQEAAAQQPSEG